MLCMRSGSCWSDVLFEVREWHTKAGSQVQKPWHPVLKVDDCLGCTDLCKSHPRWRASILRRRPSVRRRRAGVAVRRPQLWGRRSETSPGPLRRQESSSRRGSSRRGPVRAGTRRPRPVPEGTRLRRTRQRLPWERRPREPALGRRGAERGRTVQAWAGWRKPWRWRRHPEQAGGSPGCLSAEHESIYDATQRQRTWACWAQSRRRGAGEGVVLSQAAD